MDNILCYCDTNGYKYFNFLMEGINHSCLYRLYERSDTTMMYTDLSRIFIIILYRLYERSGTTIINTDLLMIFIIILKVFYTSYHCILVKCSR
jgi:hypothetical protein